MNSPHESGARESPFSTTPAGCQPLLGSVATEPPAPEAARWQHAVLCLQPADGAWSCRWLSVPRQLSPRDFPVTGLDDILHHLGERGWQVVSVSPRTEATIRSADAEAASNKVTAFSAVFNLNVGTRATPPAPSPLTASEVWVFKRLALPLSAVTTLEEHEAS